MSKINNKVLIIVLVVLAAIYFGNKFLGNSGERNFREVLVKVDTSAVNKIVVAPSKTQNGDITFTKSGNTWEVAQGAQKYEADQGMVKSMLGSLVDMKPQRLVAAASKNWGKYEVTDSLGTEVKAFTDDEQVAAFTIGKFNFHQNTRTMSTFVRLEDEDEVYAVDGFLSSNFNQELNSYRNKTFLKVKKEDVASIQYNYPADSSFSFSYTDGHGNIDNMATDSVATAKYLNGLANMNQRNFVDNFDAQSHTPLYQMTIAQNSGDNIMVSCYANGDNYILHSSQNPEAYFNQGSLKIFEKLFIRQDDLMGSK